MWNYIKKDCNIMSAASSQNKHMPQCMKVSEPVESEEKHSNRIEDASDYDPGDSMPSDGSRQRSNCNGRDPAHRHIAYRRGYGKAPYGHALENHSSDSQGPDRAEQAPSPGPA